MKKITKERHIFAFHPNMEPVEKVYSGESILFDTYDAYRGQVTSEQMEDVKLTGVNPATGPLYIHEAEIGDTLKVTILSIDLEEEGTMFLRPGAGALKNFVDKQEIKKLQIKDQKVIYNDQFSFSIKPMIGVIGVATERHEIRTSTPDKHGGNMDTKEITIGSNIYFPVFQKGAMLALGDLHAIMGDGEVPICGVEIGGTVQLKVEVLKQQLTEWPIVEDEQHYYTVASAPTLDEAATLATESMFLLLHKKNQKLDKNDIIRLMGIAGDLRISQVVNPQKTAKYKIPKSVFPL